MRTILASLASVIVVFTMLTRCSPVGPSSYKGSRGGVFGSSPISSTSNDGGEGSSASDAAASTSSNLSAPVRTKFSLQPRVYAPANPEFLALIADIPSNRKLVFSARSLTKLMESLRKTGTARMVIEGSRPTQVRAYIETDAVAAANVEAATSLLFEQVDAQSGEWELRFMPVSPSNPDLQAAVDRLRERMTAVTLVSDTRMEVKEIERAPQSNQPR